MPGQIRQWTSDELANFDAFPLPGSGSVTLASIGSNQYLIDCANVNAVDIKRLKDFWNRMKGGLYPFRYQSRTHGFPHCHFRQDTAHFVTHAPNKCSVQFAIEVLPPYET
jgi:hypothetical protein